MLSKKVRELTQDFVTKVALKLAVIGFTPNILTVTGCLLNFIVAYLLYKGYFLVGAILLIIINLFDAFDGALARAKENVTKFGAFLDSTLDRYSEAIIFLGLLFHYLSIPNEGIEWEVVLIYITLTGSLTTSYARARAEGAGFQCYVGIFTRFERFLVLIFGLLIDQIMPMLIIMAVLSNITTFQRIFHIYNKKE